MNIESSSSTRSFSSNQVAWPSRMSEALQRFWVHPVAPAAAATAVAGLIGVAVGLIMPRGPVDSPQALLLLLLSFAGGVAAGFIMRAGWAALVAPLAMLAVFEFVRRGERGPSVDGLHFDSAFGILGFLIGRGVFVLVALLPMALGTGYGLWLARRLTRTFAGAPVEPRRRAQTAGRIVLAAGTVAMVALAIWIAWPASVPAVTDANGNPVKGGIAELTPIQLGGYEQWIEIRGASTENPVILYLNGGPGQSDLALSRVLLEPLHRDFTVVGWDQRGAGKSYGSLDPDTLTLESIVNDTIELTNYLRERFGQDKIFLMGESWGSIPGVLAVQRHPELYHAYIGSGQMVDLQATDRIIYDDLLAYAEAHGDDDLASTLRGFGPPPYADIWAYAYVVQHYGLIEDDYDPPQAFIDRAEQSGIGPWGIMGSEYTLIDKTNVVRGLLDMASVMYPQLQEIDFREQAPWLAVPIYIFDGEHELRGRRELSHAWFALLDAPAKEMYTFPNAGHAPVFEYAEELHRILMDVIVPATAGVAV